jgi:hypothetical protein
MDDYSLVPVEHQPDFAGVSLVPVEHNPFSADAPIQQTEAQSVQPQTQASQVQGQSSDPSAVDSASSNNRPPFGATLLHGLVDAVPGAHYAGLAQQQFHQGNYGAATLYGAEALADAALGIATFGGSTRLGAAIGGAETLAPTAKEVGAAALGRTVSNGVVANEGRDAAASVAKTIPQELSASGPTGKYYSVLFEHKLKPTSYPGLPPYKHVREANEALLQAMEGSDDFAIGMQNLGVNLRRTPTNLAPRTSPADFTWHHADEPGVMQLVPREQHKPGSIFQDVLHPGGKGGFFKWGKK